MSLTPEFVESCRGQNILIIEPFFWTPHVETGLELAELFAKENEVAYVGPDALRCVTDETYKLTSRVLNSLSRKRHVSRYLRGSARKYTCTEIAALKAGLNLAEPKNFIDLGVRDLGTVRFEEFDIGMGIISSLLSLTRDTAVDPPQHANYAMSLARDAIFLYRLTAEMIRMTGCDIVMLYNGRFAPVRAIRRACEASGTRYLVHEFGSTIGKYALFDCATPHQPAGYRRWADTWWHAVDDPESRAREFLDKRRRGITTNWYSYTRRQVPGCCPPRTDRQRVTFFTSSEDELAAIGDELRPDSQFCDQSHAIRSVGDACRERGSEFVVRFHPNTARTASNLFRAAREASEIVFEPSSEVDTYALIDSSDIVFTHNSTVGIEAAATGKRVFYTGRNIFEQCRSVNRIMTDADLAQAMETSGEPDPLDALRYANFLGTHGIPYRYYNPRGFALGAYRGLDLNAPLSGLLSLKLHVTRGAI